MIFYGFFGCCFFVYLRVIFSVGGWKPPHADTGSFVLWKIFFPGPLAPALQWTHVYANDVRPQQPLAKKNANLFGRFRSVAAKITQKERKPRFYIRNVSVKKNRCFLLEETFFLSTAMVFKHCSFYHFGSIWGHNSAFIFVFVKSLWGLCNREKFCFRVCFCPKKKAFGGA